MIGISGIVGIFSVWETISCFHVTLFKLKYYKTTKLQTYI